MNTTIVAAVHELLADESSLIAKLAKYNFGSGDAPAIFTVDPAPENSSQPLIVITQIGGTMGTARDRSHRGGEVSIDVRLWGDKGDSEKTLREIADQIWLLLDRADLSVNGFEVVNVRAEAPQRLSDPQGFPGYLVPVFVLVRVT